MLPSDFLKSSVKRYAEELGFDLVRITSAEDFEQDRKIALERINLGLMDGLPWYTPDRVARGTSPTQLLPEARSIICLGLNYYRPAQPAKASELTGRVAIYAQGRDYHKFMKQRMRRLVEKLSTETAIPIKARWYVDDGPMLDRAAAGRSGIGWFGKNTNILSPGVGSWILLGQIITDLELEPDATLKKSCGSCVRCIDSCPTGAIVGPSVLDNRKCISFQTIENRGAIPRELRTSMGDWVFGCDLCQEVCPVNRGVPITKEPEFQRQDLGRLDLVALLNMDEAQFVTRFAGTPIMRAKLAGMKRNACVALGNSGSHEASQPLSQALGDESALVRSHAAWALGQIGGEPARTSLKQAETREHDPEVLLEIKAALMEQGSDRKARAEKAP